METPYLGRVRGFIIMEHINMKKCLNCGYERQPKDEGIFPATECPRCHIIYDKVKNGVEALKDSIGQQQKEKKEFENDSNIFGIYGQAINKGLSPVARITIGIFAGFFGVVMIYVASQMDDAMSLHMFGAFCLLIAFVCATKGRVRQFFGSLIGCAVFAMAIAYVGTEVAAGVFWSDRRSEPSVFNALMSFFIFGIPGAAYVYKARFGFRKQP
jgi:hypothetical protein